MIAITTQMIRQFRTDVGSRLPYGATWSKQGTNFSIFSREAQNLELQLYESQNSLEPFQVIKLDPNIHRTIFSWHVYVHDLSPGILYTWHLQRPDGTWWVVLDPLALAVCDSNWHRHSPVSTSNSLRGIVSAVQEAGKTPAYKPKSLEGAIIYEMHVGSFTQHPSAGVGDPGTFSGLVEKIPYLKSLGITHVELMPIMAFDEQDVPAGVEALGHTNYWGYSPYGFYAPHPSYCATGKPVQEFRDLVDAFHEAGIGVILDVVFNHTSEGGADGPTIHFKALESDIFYHRDPHDPTRYLDYTGCGNTVNCNHPLVTDFLVRCLEYWAQTMRVDGFRFDLASVFARGQDGSVIKDPPLPWSIELSPALVEAPVIAEAWDAAGLYQVGSFPGARWAEWNGRYRDVIRRFVRGDKGLIGEVANCLAGSADLYAHQQRLTTSSINLITCHDGFTLWDLVSYNAKHNEQNGEGNRDGSNDNFSWNCGIEGNTADTAILALRHKQVRNFTAILLLSQGIPMLMAGDEVLKTQNGNNNPWCLNNEVSWFNWQLTEMNHEMLRFVRELIAFRRRHPSLTRIRYLTGRVEPARGIPDIAWHGVELNQPRWENKDAQVLGFTLAGRQSAEEDIYFVANMSEKVIEIVAPEIPGRSWHLAVDTAALAPNDIVERERQLRIRDGRQTVDARSVKVFESR